jgi:2,3-bisphosphoglycerate-independent phosphoglycerate mutase
LKYVVLIGDGMTDWPAPELGDRTPLQAAFTPNMDKLAREGTVGMVRTVPDGFPPGSDVANLSIMGYDPAKYYTGRAPFEAASMGVELGESDVAFRCNLVTLSFDKTKRRARMDDHSAGHISTEEARVLVEFLDRELGSDEIKFYPGVSYRHLVVLKNAEVGSDCTPPHDILGKDITDYLPLGKSCECLKDLMLRSVGLLEGHEINRKRVAEGKRPANSIWLWGEGKKPSLPTFQERYGLRGSLVSAVDLMRGLGIYAGFEILEVPGVTGYLDTNFVGKAEHSLKALERNDLAYIHVEAPDEAGHSGNASEKVKAIEDFDALVVGTMLRGLKAFDAFRILVMPDHATPLKLRTHSAEPVPFAIFDSTKKKASGAQGFTEEVSKSPEAVVVDKGYELMDYFIKGGKK